MEVWRDIPGFEGLYRASNFGRVKALPRTQIFSSTRRAPRGFIRHYDEKILKGTAHRDARGKVRAIMLCLRKDGRYHHRTAHALVLEAFVGPRPHGHYGCHVDDCPENNRLSNLYWGTPTENCADKIRNGNQPRGEAIPCSKLTATDVEFIRKNAGKISQSAMANRFGVHQPQISRIINRKGWQHVS